MASHPDLETCSWCTTEVEDRTLTALPDGARVCGTCLSEFYEDEPEAEDHGPVWIPDTMKEARGDA